MLGCVEEREGQAEEAAILPCLCSQCMLAWAGPPGVGAWHWRRPLPADDRTRALCSLALCSGLQPTQGWLRGYGCKRKCLSPSVSRGTLVPFLLRPPKESRPGTHDGAG